MRATIEIKGIASEKHTYESYDIDGVVNQLMADQDLYCLLNMGQRFDENVSSLEEFMNLYESGKLTNEDIKNMNIQLSIGTIKCINFKK